MSIKGHPNISLLSSTDEAWHNAQRRLVHAAFSTTSILKYEPWVDDTIEVLLRELKNRFLDRKKASTVVDLYRWMSYFSADVISNLTFGQRTGYLETGSDIMGIQAGVQKVFSFWLIVSDHLGSSKLDRD
jgi:cytochrome P450